MFLPLIRALFQKTSNAIFEYAGQPVVQEPTWPLDRERLRSLKVYWPVAYKWAPSASFLEPVRQGIARWAKVERQKVPQPYQGVAVFEVALAGGVHRVAIDFHDLKDRLEYDCLRSVSLYFKMQYRRRGYSEAGDESTKIVPGGYVMADHRLTPGLPALRLAGRSSPSQFNVYGRFGLEFAQEIRSRAVEILRSDPRLGYEGGLSKVRYRQSVREAAGSKICIDLPGNGDLCFRLMDYLAAGAFVIAYPHNTRLPMPLVDGQHLVYMKPDLSDLADLCRYYLKHDGKRREIQRNAAEYFDKYCHYMQLGSWYLHECLARL
jgi:hypothetical protein